MFTSHHLLFIPTITRLCQFYLLPRELQRIYRVMQDCCIYSIILSSHSLISSSSQQQSTVFLQNAHNQIIWLFVNRFWRLLCRAVVGGAEPNQAQSSVNLESTELSLAMAKEIITITSVTSPEPENVTIESDSDDLSIPYGYGRQVPVVLPIHELDLPIKAFNVRMSITLAPTTETPEYHRANHDSPISTAPFDIFDKSKQSIMVNTGDVWETRRRAHSTRMSHEDSLWHWSPTQHNSERKLSLGVSFPKKKGTLQHGCRACGQPLMRRTHPKTPNESATFNLFQKRNIESNVVRIQSTCKVIHIKYGSPSELTQTVMEPIRNKRFLTELLNIKGAVFIITFLFYLKKSNTLV